MLRRIVNFIFEYSDYLLLTVLIILSFSILMSNDVPEMRAIQGQIDDLFQFVHYPARTIDLVSGLVKENYQLREENIQLRLMNGHLREVYLENQRLHKMLNFADTLRFELTAARVINKGTTVVFNSILLDVGRNQNIAPQMAVLAAGGIIGKTIAVGDNTCLVQTMKDANFRISIKFQTSRVDGILKWYNESIYIVAEVPKTSEIFVGENVITSGYSDVYPAGIHVGVVTRVSASKDGLHQEVYVKPAVEVGSVEEVFIIRAAQ